MTANMPMVAIHYDDKGRMSVYGTADVAIFTVCDGAPNDRVYCHKNTDDRAKIIDLIWSSPIGNADDGTVLPPALQAMIDDGTFAKLKG